MMIAVLAEPAGVNFSIHELQVVNDSLMLFLSVAVTGRRWLSLHVVYASNRGCFFPVIAGYSLLRELFMFSATSFSPRF